jgi:outer membrane scaffolding protein for murein synthesis (MipA/OmpV family)
MTHCDCQKTDIGNLDQKQIFMSHKHLTTKILATNHSVAIKTKRSPFYMLALATILFPYSNNTNAFHLPLWEFGLGAGALNAPHYRGSKTVENIYLPVPYIIYRGDFLKVDRDGIRSELFDTDRMRLDISLAGNIPVPETNKSARAGMPGLDPLIELGPEIEFKLWQTANDKQNIWFKFPYRLVFSVGNPIMEYQGWSLSPYINYRVNWRESRSLTRFNISVGPLYASNKYHDYFYTVEPKYVTPERPEYNADTGYSGSRVTVTLSRNTDKYFIGTFARYDDLQNASFEDSPLVETHSYFIFGIVFAWIFSSSGDTVPHQE